MLTKPASELQFHQQHHLSSATQMYRAKERIYTRHLDGFPAFSENGVSLGCKPFSLQVKRTDCFPDDLGSAHSTHIRWLTTTSNSSFRRSDALSVLCGVWAIYASGKRHTHTHTHTCHTKRKSSLTLARLTDAHLQPQQHPELRSENHFEPRRQR